MFTSSLSELVPATFSDDSKVWIYQSSRAFIEKEVAEINEQLYQFYVQWQAHGEPVMGWAQLLYRQFIVVMADESSVKASGCSIDGSVRVVKSLERQYSVNFFDRLMITFLRNGKAEMLPFEQIQYAIDKGFINGDTPLFNNIIATKGELMTKWLVPLKESWLGDRVQL